mmetsp:Transcript_27529/g.72571  ORF Transcript_27529/g.72571 Transcript_27529/m.72571 type:complete len:209 (+) Transcript_27529:300-926(+)
MQNFHAGVHHAHHLALRSRSATSLKFGRRSIISLGCHSCCVGHCRALGSHSTTDDGPRALSDVHGALPTCPDLAHRLPQRNLHRLGETILHGMSQLAVGVRPPAKDTARLCYCHGVPTTAREIRDDLGLQGSLHFVGFLLPNTTLSMEAPTELTEVIVTPSVKLSFLGEDTHMLVTRTDFGNFQALDSIFAFGFVSIAPRFCEEARKV